MEPQTWHFLVLPLGVFSCHIRPGRNLLVTHVLEGPAFYYVHAPLGQDLVHTALDGLPEGPGVAIEQFGPGGVELSVQPHEVLGAPYITEVNGILNGPFRALYNVAHSRATQI